LNTMAKYQAMAPAYEGVQIGVDSVPMPHGGNLGDRQQYLADAVREWGQVNDAEGWVDHTFRRLPSEMGSEATAALIEDLPAFLAMRGLGKGVGRFGAPGAGKSIGSLGIPPHYSALTGAGHGIAPNNVPLEGAYERLQERIGQKARTDPADVTLDAADPSYAVPTRREMYLKAMDARYDQHVDNFRELLKSQHGPQLPPAQLEFEAKRLANEAIME